VNNLITRASSINRALDQVGDKWCLLIIQQVFWGINSFNEMKDSLGVSRGVLADRLKWLESIDCLERADNPAGGRRKRYFLTPKTLDLYHCALMGMAWERQFYSTPDLDSAQLVHLGCGKPFTPLMCCASCGDRVAVRDIDYAPGPGATQDERGKKVRRRSSTSIGNVPSKRSLYRNLVNVIGDRWTANVLALAFHGLKRFDEFHGELPIATNILTDRLKFLVRQGVFEQTPYQQRPIRYEYRLTEKGEATYPFFLALLQWGDRWCDTDGAGKPMNLTHRPCHQELSGEVRCSACDGALQAKEVQISFAKPRDAGRQGPAS